MTVKELHNNMFFKAVSKLLGPQVVRVSYMSEKDLVLIYVKKELIEELTRDKRIGYRTHYNFIVCSALLGDDLWEELTFAIEDMSRTLSLKNSERISYQILVE